MTATQQIIRDEIARADSYRAADTDLSDPCEEILTSWVLVIGSATREMRRALAGKSELVDRAKRDACMGGGWWAMRAYFKLYEIEVLMTRFAEYQQLAFLAAALSVGDDNPFFVVQS